MVRALPRELRSSHLTVCGDRVDFIAPAENMKSIFKALHCDGAISIAVHRVGNSLILEGLEAGVHVHSKLTKLTKLRQV